MTTFISVLIAFATAIICAGIELLAYGSTCSEKHRSSRFFFVLAALAVITAMIMLVQTENIIYSVSFILTVILIRFHKVIADPVELAFLFWAAGIRIVSGTEYYWVAIAGSVSAGALIILYFKISKRFSWHGLILELENKKAEKAAMSYISLKTKRAELISKDVFSDRIKIHYEVRLKEEENAFLDSLLNISGIKWVRIYKYENSDY